MPQPQPCMLVILDGWGIGSNHEGNAIHLAETPTLDELNSAFPSTQLLCSGEAVGLPEGIMGNSEVGHLNIGAGRVVYQDLLRIDMAIRDGSFFGNKVLNSAMARIKANGTTLHMMGLLSDGGVHSQLNHLLALLDMAKKKDLGNVCVHAILDGRDTAPDSGVGFLRRLNEYLQSTNSGTIATVCGRFYAMDRDNRWERIEKAFNLFTRGDGIKARDPVTAVEKAYLRNETDEFIQPIVITGAAGNPLGLIQNGDGLICFNFRADRVREITRVFTQPVFEFFKRNPYPKLCEFVCMTLYDQEFKLPIAFPPIRLEAILGEVISRKGLSQLRIAETEKYAHVTYFFNGGQEKPFPLEERCLIPSPREIPTYDLKPEMSAYLVTEEILSRLQSKKYDFIVLNFANMDMVGHTGVLQAAIRACETVDSCLNRIVSQVRLQGGVALITADHGNSERMIDENGKIYTAHTLNPVPFILVDEKRRDAELRAAGCLGDIAPTILEIMGIEQPKQMTGVSLLADNDIMNR
ncbi:MAG: 2,3-bisphosphoglycerate-independent phosphoglycerate mutase [Deltaproteobacteria bacterium]|nr:MAG: 2,3-bisphosphoglycerate-independent phosphoglycerate mutase [Deltaproteobacteria bacterium]